MTTKLTTGQLRWLLDPDVPRGVAALEPHSSLPERIEKLRRVNSPEDQQIIDQFDNLTDSPTRLLASYDNASLLSRIEISPHMKGYVKDFIEKIVEGITISTDLHFQLPTPLFQHDENFCLETLIPRHCVDLSTIAYDSISDTRLTLVQDHYAFSTLKQTGIYKLGDFEISFHWYPGLENIRRWKREAYAESLYQWTVQLPSTLVGRDCSILLGLWQFISGIAITFNRLIGLLPTWLPKYTQDEIERECAKKYFEWLQDSKGFMVKATEVIPVQKIAAGSNQAQRYAVIFEHKTLGTLDLRTSVPFIKMRLENILAQAQRVAHDKIGGQRMAIITSMMSQSLEEDAAISKYLDMWHRAYLQAIRDMRYTIDKISSLPGLTDTVLREEEARLLVAQSVKAKEKEQREIIEERLETWKELHPLRAASGKFVARQLAVIESRTNSFAVSLDDGLQNALRNAGIEDLVMLANTQDEFERSNVYKTCLKTMKSSRKSEIITIAFLKFPNKCTIKQIKVSGETLYELECFRQVRVHSTTPLWRMQAFTLRYFSWIWNSSFFLLNKASRTLRRWNLFYDSFEIRLLSVNPSTGAFETMPIRTLRGRFSALIAWKETTLQEARSSEHIIRLGDGLYFDMCWAYCWTTVGLGLGTTSVFFYTIGETLFAIAGAGIAVFTSPVWSLIANFGYSLFNALIYDYDLDASEESAGSFFRNVFGLSTILTSATRSIFHLIKGAVVWGGGAELRHAWDRTWHIIMTALLKRTEVPTRAEGFFWSTSGPGMKNPFVLIDADVATLALLAHLSQQELLAARQEMEFDLQHPRRVLEERIQNDSGYAMSLHDIRLVADALNKIERSNKDDVNEFEPLIIAERQYGDLLQGVSGNPQIRMTAHELDMFLTRALPIFKKFYLERHFPRLAPPFMIVEFWESRNLAPGDWQGLTRCLLARMFTDEIIVPFEAASQDLFVSANRVSGLERIVQEALNEQGLVTGISTLHHIRHPIRTREIPALPFYENIPIRYYPQPTE